MEPKTLAKDYDLDRRAAENLVAYLREQQAATRVVPSDESIVVERFRDEIGDWRLCVLSPFGGRVHAAWGLALSARIRDDQDLEADAIWSDDGIVVHLPDADEAPPADIVMLEPDELEDLVVRELGGSALFGARFRENAARSLLLPARLPRQAHTAVAAAPEVAEPARGGQGLPSLPGHARDLPRVPARRARPAFAGGTPARPPFAQDLAGGGRDAHGLPVRVIAAVRLRRHVHVRGRHAQRRAAGGRPRARPRPAARAPGAGGTARADRSRRPGRGRGVPPAPGRSGARPRPRRAPGHPAPARRPDRGGVPGARGRGVLGHLDAGQAHRRAQRCEGDDRRGGALDRRRGRRPLPRRPRRAAAGWPARLVPRTRAGRDAVPAPPLRPHPRSVPDEPGRGPLRGRPGAGIARAGAGRDPRPRRAPARRDRA